MPEPSAPEPPPPAAPAAPPPATADAPIAQPVGELREVPAFTALSVAVPARVVVTIARERRVRLVAEPDLLPLISVEVHDGELRLKGADLPRQAKVSVEISTPDLATVDLNGLGEVAISGLTGAQVRLRVVGEGRIVAHGEVRRAICAVVGGGAIDALGLETSFANASVSGRGRVVLRARVRLDAKVDGEGVVTYAGDPQVHPTVTGSGRVERLP